MKKTALIAILALLFTTLSFGCTSVDTSTQTIPSFEDLLEINTYDNILDKNTNFYVKNVWHKEETNTDHIQEIVFMKGEKKINYHLRNKNLTTNEYEFSASRVDNEFYHVTSVPPSMCILELGELSLLDEYVSVLPPILYGNVVGKGYIENDKIVYHTSMITEGFEDIPAKRNDATFYFNKETKFIEKVDEIEYTSDHKIACNYTVEFSYDVEIEQIFPTTTYDEVRNSEKRIDLEIILNYGEETQQTYSFVTTTDMQPLVSVDFTVYSLYADCEFTKLISTLDEYEGQKSLTLYAKLWYEI